MANQPGIVLYQDNYQNVRGVLTQAQKGELLDALMDGTYQGSDQLVTMAYNIFAAAIRRTDAKYQEMRKKNQENARKRWERIREKADAYDRMRAEEDAYKAMPDDASQSQSHTQSETESHSKRNIFHPPTAAEVAEYIAGQGYRVDPERFIDYYQTRGWVLRPGQRMKDWKAAVRTWAKNQKERGWDNDMRGSRPENRITGQRDQYDDDI